MQATHVVQISFRSGNGVEVASNEENLNALVKAFNKWNDDDDNLQKGLEELYAGRWYTLLGVTKSGKPTRTIVDLSNIELINIAELPSDLALPRPTLTQ